jgi:methylated-DNA-[protein]-cysteine S-methyltransferase
MILAQHDSPLGRLTLVSIGAALSGLYFEKHKVGGPPREARPGSDGIIDAARRQLDEYFAGQRRDFDLPVAPSGTEFQVRIWNTLQTIGYGETRTYLDMAQRVGAPKAARAAGAAIGRNPVSIVIPCHRVVGAAGALTGYAGGVARKRALLALEQGEARSMER